MTRRFAGANSGLLRSFAPRPSLSGLVWSFAVALVSACAAEVDDGAGEAAVGSVRQAQSRTQGGQVQGGQVQGGQVQGGQVQGGGVITTDGGTEVIVGSPITTHIERISPTVTFRGLKAKALVRGGALQVQSADGVLHAGSELVGVTLRGYAPASVPVPAGQFAEYDLRIDEAFQDPVTGLNMIDTVWPASLRSNADIWLYRVSQRPANSTDKWVPLCSTKTAKGGGEAADSRACMFLSGYWQQANKYTFVDDPTYFTFACHDGVAAKCARWGYKPWVSISTSSFIDFKQLHRACVRAATADYCGEGVSFTINGTSVDVYDNYNLALKVPGSVEPGYAAESTFSPKGAECVERYRWDTAQRCAYTEQIKQGMSPAIVVAQPVDTCGVLASTGTTWVADMNCSAYWGKTQVGALFMYQEGQLSTCLRSLLPATLIKVASSTYCTHASNVTGKALGKSCSDVTECVCGHLPQCCSRDGSWSAACVSQASICSAMAPPPGGLQP